MWRCNGSLGDIAALFQSGGYQLSYGYQLLDGLPGVKERRVKCRFNPLLVSSRILFGHQRDYEVVKHTNGWHQEDVSYSYLNNMRTFGGILQYLSRRHIPISELAT